MKKNKLCLIIVILIIGCTYIAHKKSIYFVDKYYLQKFGEVCSNYDISEMDKYLSTDTLITYGENSALYGDIRQNVIEVFNARSVVIKDYDTKHATYYAKYNSNELYASTRFCGVLKNLRIPEDSLKGTITNNGKGEAKVLSLSSDSPVFGYLFFGQSSVGEPREMSIIELQNILDNVPIDYLSLEMKYQSIIDEKTYVNFINYDITNKINYNELENCKEIDWKSDEELKEEFSKISERYEGEISVLKVNCSYERADLLHHSAYIYFIVSKDECREVCVYVPERIKLN